MKKQKILISGAGIAGFMLAYWLKQRGFRPTIVEKYPHVRGGGYKVDVRGAALEVAKRMGVYQDLLEANVNLVSSKFVSSDYKVFEFDGDLLGHSSEGEIEINRWDLAQILSKKVGEVEIIHGDSITKIDEKMVYFEKMEPREFDIVVGADGQYSNVRRITFGEDSEFLRRYGIQFCVFPIPNIFELSRCEVVFFDKGRLATAYAVEHHSYACLAFKSNDQMVRPDGLKEVFEKQFQGLDWEVPHLISLMKESDECYFNSIAQVRMPCWSKGRVVLIGDAAHSVQAMGTSLAMVGAYILARELDASNGECAPAFEKYEKAIRSTVEAAQELAEENQQAFTGSSKRMKCMFYLMKFLPKKIIQYVNEKGKKQMKKVANMLTLEQGEWLTYAKSVPGSGGCVELENGLILEWKKADILSPELAHFKKTICKLASEELAPTEVHFLRTYPEAVSEELFLRPCAPLLENGPETADWKIIEDKIRATIKQFYLADLANFGLDVIKPLLDDIYFFAALKNNKEDQVLGFIMFAVTPALAFGNIKVINLLVRSTEQNSGLEKVLLDCIFTIIPKVKRIFLFVRPTNITALQMYSALGFTQDLQPFQDPSHKINTQYVTSLEYKVKE